ncbi:MAG: polysaccharide deacetylase family protein [Oscillospiraceae bacterium]|nr:polysaccharide deacetylase family protein [Oscillospiraceae bacterium]
MIRLKNVLIVLVILVIVVTALVYTIVKFGNNIAVAVSGGVLSNKKMGWGVSRGKNHAQPSLGKYEQIIEKYDGIAMGNPNDKIVYLTFDAGYEAGYTPKILDVLKANNVKATFFITAYFLDSKPELVKRMLDEGHIVGNHLVRAIMYAS